MCGRGVGGNTCVWVVIHVCVCVWVVIHVCVWVEGWKYMCVRVCVEGVVIHVWVVIHVCVCVCGVGGNTCVCGWAQ